MVILGGVPPVAVWDMVSSLRLQLKVKEAHCWTRVRSNATKATLSGRGRVFRPRTGVGFGVAQVVGCGG